MLFRSYKPFLPATAYALAASRHMHEFGTTREQMAEVAVAARKWAQMNPVAWDKKPLSVADVLAARPISYPFTVRDICLVTDGGGAIVMTRADRAKSLRKPPVYVLGCGQSITHASITSMPNLTHTGAIEAGRQAYAAAGMKASEIDLCALYDAFTINTILFLEDLGFCAKGEVQAFIRANTFTNDGTLPLNTSGGQLSVGQAGAAGGYLGVVEALRQVTRRPLGEQVPEAELALVSGFGMINYDRGLCSGAAIVGRGGVS